MVLVNKKLVPTMSSAAMTAYKPTSPLLIKGRMRAAIDPTQRFRLVPVQVRYAVTLSRLGGDDRFSRECQQVGIIIESPDDAAASLAPVMGA
jgi:hypothetical protein